MSKRATQRTKPSDTEVAEFQQRLVELEQSDTQRRTKLNRRLRDGWRQWDSRFDADVSLTLRAFSPNLPLKAPISGKESFEGQLLRLFRLVEEHLYGIRKNRKKHHQVERTCYIHKPAEVLHAHLYIKLPTNTSHKDFERLFRCYWYVATYEHAYGNTHSRFDMNTHHFKWHECWNDGWNGYGSHEDEQDDDDERSHDELSGWNERVSFLRKRSTTSRQRQC